MIAKQSKRSNADIPRLAVSVDTAAAMLSVSSKTIRRSIEKGELKSARVLGTIRIPMTEIESRLRDSK